MLSLVRSTMKHDFTPNSNLFEQLSSNKNRQPSEQTSDKTSPIAQTNLSSHDLQEPQQEFRRPPDPRKNQ